MKMVTETKTTDNPDLLKTLKASLKSGNVVIGTEKTMKDLKAGNIKTVMCSSNVPGDVREEIEHYAQMASVEVMVLDIPNDELGVLCQKPFSISVLGLK